MKRILLVAIAACSNAASPSAPDAAQVTGPIVDPGVDASAPVPPAVQYPDPDWPTGTPGTQGMDGAKLDAAAAAAGASESSCLLVIRHGVLVSETYFNGATAATTPLSWSLAKSYTSTIVGIALGNHDLPGLDAKIADHIPSWLGTPRESIALRDLVSMTSGLTWSVFQDYIAMAEVAPDKSAFATGLATSVAPGAAWVYHNGGVQMIEAYFRAVTGVAIDAYAQAHLWGPIGTTATWAHDATGHPTTYANVMTTCRDHARLGYLFLHGGKWKQAQVVPSAWVTAATTSSQPYNRGYGYLWWLNGESPVMSSLGATTNARLQPYAPPDLFAAHGFGGQFIDVIPSLDLVVVRFAKDEMTAGMSGNLAEITQVVADDQFADSHRAILEPILASIVGP